MNVGIIGNRNFTDFGFLEKSILDLGLNIHCIISGGAKGADSLGEEFANKYNIPKLIFKPEWSKYGKIAGFIRNTEIIEKSDIILAFWDGVSKGTLDSINKAKKLNKTIQIYEIKNN